MAEQRRATRVRLEEAAAGGLVVGVAPGGRLHWITPDDLASPSATELTRAAPEPAQGGDVVSAEERALIHANHAKLDELRTLPYPSPDLHDVMSEILGRTHPSTLSLAVAAWVLQATGLIPMPIFDSAAAAVTAVGFVGRRFGHQLHRAAVSPEATEGATRLWNTHPGLATEILTTVLSGVIDSIKNAASVDDTELEDELDAFYPRWSRTDFEFDPWRHLT